MSSGSFAQTRAQALNFERQTDPLLSRYSACQNSVSSVPLADEAELQDAIQEILAKRDEVISTLVRIAESDISLSTLKLQQLQRHKEILNDHKKVFNGIRATILGDRNRNNLLFSVRSDIDAHKQRTTQVGGPSDANDYINQERVRVDGATSLADRLLPQAFHTRDELFSQRGVLANAQLSMMGTIQQFPGLNTLILKINTRRRRDTLILATVISVCIVMLFMF